METKCTFRGSLTYLQNTIIKFRNILYFNNENGIINYKNPQNVKMIFIDFSIKFAAFLILFILYTPYLATGTAPAFTIKSSASPDVAKSKNAFAVSESSAFFFVTNTKLR